MFKEKCNQIFRENKITASEIQLEQLELYYSLIVEWNKKFNLTRIIDENDFIEKHLLDSLSPLSIIQDNTHTLDIGVGAGFPSIPLKIMNPSLKMTMIDSVGKKVTFLNAVIEALNLKEIQAIHCRAEDYIEGKRESFDFVLSRAVASLNTLLEYCLPFTKIDGTCIFYKSDNSEFTEELKVAQTAFSVLKAYVSKSVSYSTGNTQRLLLLVKKTLPTSKTYPRNKNLPRTKPL